MLLRLVTLILLAMPASVAQAHHSTAMYDLNQTVTLKGVVTDFIYTNPHTWLILAVIEADGSVTTWGFEGEGPGYLFARGIDEEDFVIGESIEITGNPMRDGRPAAHWITVTKADGTVLDPQGPFVR